MIYSVKGDLQRLREGWNRTCVRTKQSNQVSEHLHVMKTYFLKLRPCNAGFILCEVNMTLSPVTAEYENVLYLLPFYD